MEGRAIIDRKETECDEKHQHDDTCRHRVCREVAPPWIIAHASRKHQPSEPRCRERRDGADYVSARLRGYAVDHHPREEASQHDAYPAEQQEGNSQSTAIRRPNALM